MDNRLESTDQTAQSHEGDIIIHSAIESEPRTNDGEEFYDDEGYTDEDYEDYDEGEKKEKEMANIEKPHVGMVFDSVEHAYQFYKKYGREMGFGIRRGSSRKSRRDNALIWRELLCNKEGWRRVKNVKTEAAKQKRRGETRTGCQGKLVVKLRGEDGKWIVSIFEEKHNHQFDTSKKHQLLSSDKNFTGNQGDLVNSKTQAGIKTNLMINHLFEDASGSKGTELDDRDVWNHMHTIRKTDLRKEEAQGLLHYFNDMQAANPNFFYAIQLDLNCQVTSFFWADAISRMDYNYFGDVVYFDAAYWKHMYKTPFIPIFGLNHHMQPIYFGGALIFNETEASYAWLLETWTKAMKGKHPKTIFTDQDSVMSGAIGNAFPHTHHRYCLWHIIQNAQKHLEHLYKPNYPFAKDFSNCICNNGTIEEFESSWESLLTTYNLQGNDWIATLYSKRQQWMPFYSKDVFSADMDTTQRTESINKYFKDFLTNDMLLPGFVRAVDKAIVYRREKELKADFHDNYVPPSLRVHMQIEDHAGKVYTKSLFEKFQDELLLSLRFMSIKTEDDGITSTFRCWLENREYTVKTRLEDSSANCSCQKFEYAGILCSHILKVYSVTNVVNLPSQYILKRWTRDAKCGVIHEEGEQIQADSQTLLSVRHSSLCNQGMNIAAKGASSLEVYRVARNWLERTLNEVEIAFKRTSLESMGSNKNDTAMLSEADCSNNQVLIRGPPPSNVKGKGWPGRMDSCLEKNHKRKPACKENESESSQHQIEIEMEEDLHTEKKHKNKRIPTTSNGLESRSGQHHEDEGSIDGPSVSIMNLEAPGKLQSMNDPALYSRPIDGYATYAGVNKLNIHRPHQDSPSSFNHQYSNLSPNSVMNITTTSPVAVSSIQLHHLNQGNTKSNISNVEQSRDSTTVVLADSSQASAPSDAVNLKKIS